MRTAFKEWAVVVDALGRGDQIIILRKGGISEGPGGFQVEQPQFLLFPTLFHQQRASVLPAAQARFDIIEREFSPADVVRIEYVAEVVHWQRVDDLAAANQLRGQHIWRDDVIAQRFDWGKSKNIFALAVRVSRLAEAAELPLEPSYGGCKSWIELAIDLETADAEPVLDENEFQRKLSEFKQALSLPVL